MYSETNPYNQSRISGPSYSVASCIVETARRLIATPRSSSSFKSKRATGHALLTAEILSFKKLTDTERYEKPGQGLEITLGFYDQQSLDITTENNGFLREEISLSLGGWEHAIQLNRVLLSDKNKWLGAAGKWNHYWNNEVDFGHLDSIESPSANEYLDKRIFRFAKEEQLSINPGIVDLLMRRLRYRIGFDHAKLAKEEIHCGYNFFWWTTKQTEEWVSLAMSDYEEYELSKELKFRFQQLIRAYAHHAPISGEPALNFDIDFIKNDPDDWGLVDLEKDPLVIKTVGPKSRRSSSHNDVHYSLKTAGNQIKVKSHHVSLSAKGARNPFQPYAEELESILQEIEEGQDDYFDILFLYRGGFGYYDRGKDRIEDDCKRILNVATKLTYFGKEVVLAFAHGDTSIRSHTQEKLSIGVYEALTPTAGANWIIREHVCGRLLQSEVDYGQPLIP